MPAEITAQCLTTYVSSAIVAVFSLEAAPRRLCFSYGELLDHFLNKRRDVGRSTGDQAVDEPDFLYRSRSHGSSGRSGPPATTSGAITREPEHPPAPVVPGQSPPRVRVPERNGGLIPGRLRHLDLFKENLPPEPPLFSSRFFACRVRQRARRARPDDPALTARSRSDCDRPPPG